ncbi:glycosyltransferase family 4 protein [bacterium]|nr:glycosyltransferase family 4 protein [bacterium]
MIIGIDASRFNLSGGTGVEHYSVKIIQGLIDYFKHQKNHTLVLYSPKKLTLYKTGTVKHRIIPFPRLWTKIRLSIEMLFHKPDVLFVPSHVLPHFSPKKSIITIHDVAFMHLKKEYSRFQYWYLKKTTKYAVKKTSAIIVPSFATQQDLIKFFKCPSNKIVVIPHGCDFKIKKLSTEKDSEILSKMGLAKNDNFFLFIGRLENKKNIGRIISAFLAFHETFPNWKLILAGKRGQGFGDIFKKALKSEAFKYILMPGYITENEKHVLLKYCNAFIFPSLYEGFGFPILEAYTYHKPVITSHEASIPEVAGNGAIYVDAKNSASIKEGMEKLIKNPKLKEETTAMQNTILSKFTWDKAIKKTIDILIQ